MVKILSKSGDSLADTYDVVGSVAGIEQLNSRDVDLVHEMGATMFSERLSATIRRATSGAVLQSAAWDVILNDLPAGMWRVLGVVLIADTTARADRAMVALRDPLAGRELPLITFDSGNDVTQVIRLDENGAGITDRFQLVGTPTPFPTLGVGTGQPQRVQEISFRGVTSAFGAGTVTVVALIHIAFSRVAGISSRGLPIPAW